MARPLDVAVEIDREPEEVWQEVAVIERHVEWMADADQIRFLTAQRQGVGTRFECDTRVGPLTTTDVMEVTRWEPVQRIGVRHTGAVSGSGEFTLHRTGDGRTRFRWREQLRFPWYFGSRIGAFVAAPLLRWIWRRNLAGLKTRLER
jgi:uncharacterized protein YndB with AHSA1/START domain